jgi:hypothetical protein
LKGRWASLEIEWSQHTPNQLAAAGTKSLDIVSPRAATEDHKAHSSSRKNKTDNWNPVRAGAARLKATEAQDHGTKRKKTRAGGRPCLAEKIKSTNHQERRPGQEKSTEPKVF